MTLLALVFIALVVVLLLAVGMVVGWVAGTTDEHIDAIATRLAAEREIEQITRDTLHAMRDAVRGRSPQ